MRQKRPDVHLARPAARVIATRRQTLDLNDSLFAVPLVLRSWRPQTKRTDGMSRSQAGGRKGGWPQLTDCLTSRLAVAVSSKCADSCLAKPMCSFFCLFFFCLGCLLHRRASSPSVLHPDTQTSKMRRLPRSLPSGLNILENMINLKI